MRGNERKETTREALENTRLAPGVAPAYLAILLLTLLAVPLTEHLVALKNALAASEVKPAAAKGIRIEATIKAIAAPPKPGTVPYKDCLIALDLEQVKSAKGKGPKGRVLVFAWGMKDNKWTPAVGLKPGTRITMDLQPWSQVEARLGSLNRIELDDDDLLLMEPWYGELVSGGKTARPASWDFFRVIPFAFPSVKELRAFEESLDEGSAVREVLLPVTQAALTGAFGLGNEQALLRGGWLYFRQDIEHLTGPAFLDPAWRTRRRAGVEAWAEPPQTDPIAAIVDFRDQLGQRGIELIVLPVPVKPSIHPEPFAGGAAELPLRNPSFADFAADLEGAGVQVFDPAPLLLEIREEAGRAYLKTDTHWTAEAMEDVALALGEQILKTEMVESGDRAWSSEAVTIEGRGDAWEMLRLPGESQLIQKEQVEVHRVLDAGSGRGQLPDRSSPVLLLGDSFTNIYSQAGLGWGADAGLPQHLARVMNRPVDWIARNAGGAYATRAALTAERLAGKRIVVWQFAERELSFGDWQMIELPPQIPAASEEPVAEPVEAPAAVRPSPEPAAAEPVRSVTLTPTPIPEEPGLEAAPPGATAEDASAFLKGLSELVKKAGDKMAIKGDKGFLFFIPELRHLAAGVFWGEAAMIASRAPKPAYKDPLPAILDFNEQLKKADIRLIFVPVPPKAVIYPDRLPLDPPAVPRIDLHHQAFYELLRSKGVEVLDLVPAFKQARNQGGEPLYCETDTHWSGRAVVLAARLLAGKLEAGKWPQPNPTLKNLKTEERAVEIKGDMIPMVSAPAPAPEQRKLTFVTDSGQPIKPWRDSPVLLLGDSHNLVFHAGGDMHATGAGLADHLARHLGYPVDVLGVRGSGATPSRISLLRRRDNLKGKQIVIWVLSAREFTEGQGWRKLPVIRK